MEKNKMNFTFKKADLYRDIIKYSSVANVIINSMIGNLYLKDFKNDILNHDYTSEEIEFLHNTFIYSHEGTMVKYAFYSMMFSAFIVMLETSLHEMIVQNTSDYQTIKTLYNELINNEVELFKSLELNDPVSAFAGYVNMYRGGYLSSDKDFTYDKNSKDFRGLQGVDVVRGQGVCRHIATMLDDIYREMGFDSTTLVVNASREAIESMEHLSSVDLDKSKISDETLKMVEKIEMITSLTKFGNHLVNAVRDGEKSYVLDPTNDGFLVPKRLFYLTTGDGPKQKMIYKPIRSIGTVDETIKILKGNTITKDEYRKIYLDSQKRINDNLDLLEKFYEENKDIYKEIEEISNTTGGLLERRSPYMIKILKRIVEEKRKTKNGIKM